jgi:hypothetical protein
MSVYLCQSPVDRWYVSGKMDIYLGHTTTVKLHKHYGKFLEVDLSDLGKRALEDLSLLPPPSNSAAEVGGGQPKFEY